MCEHRPAHHCPRPVRLRHGDLGFLEVADFAQCGEEKIRYADAPVFLDVDSAINQYSVDSSFTLSGTWFINPFEEHNAEQSLSALGGYSDKPTITYTPLSGEKFARNLMAPIPPAAILNLLQAGYPADMVLRACVHAINGIHSRFGGGARARPPMLNSIR
jgi:hypothetical protein